MIATISITTIRSVIRNYVFPLYMGVLLSGAIIFPLTIKGDGTLSGQLQISLNYTFGFIGVFLTLISLGLGSIGIVSEVESHQVDLVLTKPVPPYIFWLGKCFGIVILQGATLAFASILAYYTIMLKLRTSDYNREEFQKVDHEILVGRQIFLPKPIDVDHLVEKEFDKRFHSAPLPKSINHKAVRKELEREITLRMSEIPANSHKQWEFDRLPRKPESKLFHLRYRLYVDGDAGLDRRQTSGVWWILDPNTNAFYPIVQNSSSGAIQELPISPRMIDKNGVLILRYENRDPHAESVIFQRGDVPSLLLKVTTFLQNFLRAIVLLFLQIIFVTVLGCTASAIFSAPMAVFISSSYIVLGLLVAVLNFTSFVQNSPSPEGIIYQITSIVRLITKHFTVPLGEYYEFHRLARGELIGISRISRGFTNLILLRGMPIAFIGIWLLKKRELGLVTKK